MTGTERIKIAELLENGVKKQQALTEKIASISTERNNIAAERDAYKNKLACEMAINEKVMEYNAKGIVAPENNVKTAEVMRKYLDGDVRKIKQIDDVYDSVSKTGSYKDATEPPIPADGGKTVSDNPDEQFINQLNSFRN